MSYLRSARTFTRLANQVGPRNQVLLSRQLPSTACYSYSGYGDGTGDPRGENPQQQGPSSDAQHKAEHPGPPPPAEGRKTGGATKASSGTKDPTDSSASSGGSRSKEAKETGGSPTGGKVGGSGGEASSGKASQKAQPKISDKKIPNEATEGKQAEVEQHNREFEQRYDRAPTAEDDKVDKKFWKGQG